MEHKIYKVIKKIKMGLLVKSIMIFILIISGLSLILLPIPPSALLGLFLIVIAAFLVLDVKSIKSVIKIRKGLIYFMNNIRSKKIRKHKIRDIKKHIKKILKKK